MSTLLQRINYGVAAALLVTGLVLASVVQVNALTAPVNGTVFIGDTEFTSKDPALGNRDDIVLKSCDVTLSFYGFPAKEQEATIIFQNITGTPGSLLEEPQVPQFFTFDGSGDINALADETTYGLSLTGPAVDGLGYHIKSTVSADFEPGEPGGNVKYLTFWIPENCETEPEPEEPPVVVPPTGGGQVASATTTQPTAAQPKSLPSTGSSEISWAAMLFGAAGLVALASSIRLWTHRTHAPKR